MPPAAKLGKCGVSHFETKVGVTEMINSAVHRPKGASRRGAWYDFLAGFRERGLSDRSEFPH